MRYFPMFLDTRGRRVVIAGGGEQAAQKARLLLRTEAELVVMAPALNDELAACVSEGRARHVPCVHDENEADAAFAVFCASGCVGVDAMISARAAARGGVANVVDKPRLSTAITPALVDRDPVVVAIGTEGSAPVLAQRIKTAVESWLEPGLGSFAADLAALRPMVAEAPPAPSVRAFWGWVMDGPRRRAAAGDLDGALAEVRAAILAGGAPETAAGASHLAVIALPDGGADLLSLRAARRMQEADVIVHAPDAPAAALELARRDAERLAAEPPFTIEIATALDGGARVAALLPVGMDPSAAAQGRPGAELIGAASAG